MLRSFAVAIRDVTAEQHDRSQSSKPIVVRWSEDDDNADADADDKKKRKTKKGSKDDDVAGNTSANRTNDVAWRCCELVLDVGFLTL